MATDNVINLPAHNRAELTARAEFCLMGVNDILSERDQLYVLAHTIVEKLRPDRNDSFWLAEIARDMLEQTKTIVLLKTTIEELIDAISIDGGNAA